MSTQTTLPPETPAEAKSGGGVVLQRLVMRQFDGVTLYNADCLDILSKLVADALVSDPPYGMEQGQDMRRIKRAVTPKQKDGHLWGKDWGAIIGDDKPFDAAPWLQYPAVVLWGANHYCDQLPRGKRWLVWHKGTPQGLCASDCELAWTSVAGGSVNMKAVLWSGFRREVDIREHYRPTQKPTTIMAWCMEQAKIPQGATACERIRCELEGALL